MFGGKQKQLLVALYTPKDLGCVKSTDFGCFKPRFFRGLIHIRKSNIYYLYVTSFPELDAGQFLEEANKQVVNLFVHFPLNELSHFLRPIPTLPMR